MITDKYLKFVWCNWYTEMSNVSSFGKPFSEHVFVHSQLPAHSVVNFRDIELKIISLSLGIKMSCAQKKWVVLAWVLLISSFLSLNTALLSECSINSHVIPLCLIYALVFPVEMETRIALSHWNFRAQDLSVSTLV